MSVDAGERLQRVLRVMPFIVGHDDVSFDDLRAAAGVDAAALLDDLRALTERDDEPGGFVEAVRILFEHDRVSVQSPHFGRPMRITLPELCALELGLAMLGAGATPAERPVIDRARRRVRDAIVAFPKSAAREDLWYASAPAHGEDRVLDTLRACAKDSAKARMTYRRGDSAESTERVVHPYAVLPVRGKWFLVALCERSDGMRFFRADRIESAERLAEHFTRPKDVDLDALLAHDRALVSPSDERLVVEYSPRIARWIAEREDGEQMSDGSFVVSHPLADEAWAVRHMLQYGPEARVLSPERVREKVVATLREMAERRG
ncbi:MAG: helix-turn-helix transcriptional regulator [Gemmatimonadaceae bacterium]